MDNNQTPATNLSKIYLGNLPWSLGEDDIRELCEPFGEIVDAKLITDQRTGRSKGFAFVEFATEEAATAAIEELNEKEVDGRNLFVKVAQPKKPRRDFDGGGNRGGGYGGGRRDDNRGGYNRGNYGGDNDNYRG